MISIDTAVMRDLANVAANANNAITDAMDVLNRITTHNDWACKEKNAINDYTNTNKNRIRQLQENSASFLNAINGAAADFEQTETSISEMFSSVESMLANILSITVATPGVIGGPLQSGGSPLGEFPEALPTKMETIIKDYLPQTRMDGFNPMEAFELNNITDPISLCEFADIDLG